MHSTRVCRSLLGRRASDPQPAVERRSSQKQKRLRAMHRNLTVARVVPGHTNSIPHKSATLPIFSRTSESPDYTQKAKQVTKRSLWSVKVCHVDDRRRVCQIDVFRIVLHYSFSGRSGRLCVALPATVEQTGGASAGAACLGCFVSDSRHFRSTMAKLGKALKGKSKKKGGKGGGTGDQAAKQLVSEGEAAELADVERVRQAKEAEALKVSRCNRTLPRSRELYGSPRAMSARVEAVGGVAGNHR